MKTFLLFWGLLMLSSAPRLRADTEYPKGLVLYETRAQVEARYGKPGKNVYGQELYTTKNYLIVYTFVDIGTGGVLGEIVYAKTQGTFKMPEVEELMRLHGTEWKQVQTPKGKRWESKEGVSVTEKAGNVHFIIKEFRKGRNLD